MAYVKNSLEVDQLRMTMQNTAGVQEVLEQRISYQHTRSVSLLQWYQFWHRCVADTDTKIKHKKLSVIS
jgi:hypothetical protein